MEEKAVNQDTQIPNQNMDTNQNFFDAQSVASDSTEGIELFKVKY